jgi:hypothetical protein
MYCNGLKLALPPASDTVLAIGVVPEWVAPRGEPSGQRICLFSGRVNPQLRRDFFRPLGRQVAAVERSL